MSGSWDGGKRVAGAAALAVERVNADKSLLPQRRLEYSWADSGCSAQQGLVAMGKLLGGTSTVDAVIGPGCSSACEATSYLSGGEGTTQISYSCTAVSLSNKEKHRLVSPFAVVSRACFCCLEMIGMSLTQFSRTVAPATSKAPAMIAFMQQNHWRKIAILSSTESLWFDARLGLGKQLEEASINVLKPAAFEPGNFKDTTLSEIRQSGIRIVLVLSYDYDTQTVASLTFRESMTTGWAWLLPNDMAAGAETAGWLWFRTLLASNMQAFAKHVSDYSKSHFNITVLPDFVNLEFSAALYDAIMLYAHGATAVMSAGGDLQDGKAVTAAVRSTSFTGVGGTLVELDSNGDRVESYEVMNYVLEEGDVMSSVAVGMFNSTTGQYKAYERAVVWPGKTMEVPVDFSGEFPSIDKCASLLLFLSRV